MGSGLRPKIMPKYVDFQQKIQVSGENAHSEGENETGQLKIAQNNIQLLH